MTYYFMTETQKTEYYNIRSEVNNSGAEQTARQTVKDKIGHYPVLPTAYQKHIIKDAFDICNTPETDYLAHIPTPMAKLKNDIIAECTRYFDRSGITEGYVKQITRMDNARFHETGSWKVFKTEDGWVYQNRASNKTVHKVA